MNKIGSGKFYAYIHKLLLNSFDSKIVLANRLETSNSVCKMRKWCKAILDLYYQTEYGIAIEYGLIFQNGNIGVLSIAACTLLGHVSFSSLSPPERNPYKCWRYLVKSSLCLTIIASVQWWVQAKKWMHALTKALLFFLNFPSPGMLVKTCTDTCQPHWQEGVQRENIGKKKKIVQNNTFGGGSSSPVIMSTRG